MAENDDLLDLRLRDYGSRWRASLPTDPPFVHPPRRRPPIWLAAAVVVALALGTTVWVTHLLSETDRAPSRPTDRHPTVPWAALDPTYADFDADAVDRYSSIRVSGDLDLSIRTGRGSVSFDVTLTSPRDLSLDPCPDFTIRERFSVDGETNTTYGLNCAGVPYKTAAGDPYLPAGKPVTFAMQIPAPEESVPGLTWLLDPPGRPQALNGRVQVVRVPEPKAGAHYCAQLTYRGRAYELSTEQFGEGPGQSLGAVRGVHCGDRSSAQLQAYKMSEEVTTDVVVVTYPSGPLSYVLKRAAGTTPVPHPEVVRSSTGNVRRSDIELVRRFAEFAVTPTPTLQDQVPFGRDGANLRIGTSSHQIGPGTLADETSWTLPADGFAGRTGDLNALEPLREHLLGRLHPFQRSHGDLVVSEGDHDRCAGPPMATPEKLDGYRHIAVEPVPGSYESCLDWFAVDLYVDPKGAVVAVLLDLWEP